MLRIFQFRDPTPIEAYVLAPDADDATELFEEYVLRRSGDPDTLLFRGIRLDYLEDDAAAAAAVQEALGVGRKGLVVNESEGVWTLIVPLGARNLAPPKER